MFLFNVEVKNAGIGSEDTWGLFGVFLFAMCVLVFCCGCCCLFGVFFGFFLFFLFFVGGFFVVVFFFFHFLYSICLGIFLFCFVLPVMCLYGKAVLYYALLMFGKTV